MIHRYGNSPITDDKTQMSKTGAQVSAIIMGGLHAAGKETEA